MTKSEKKKELKSKVKDILNCKILNFDTTDNGCWIIVPRNTNIIDYMKIDLKLLFLGTDCFISYPHDCIIIHMYKS
jgi:hypothetical protein